MPIATRSYPADIVPPITAASLIAGLRDGLIASGFPQPLKQYVIGTDQYCVWEFNFDPTKTYGKTYYRLKVTSGLITTHSIGAGWTDATNTLVNPCNEAHQITYSSSVPVKSWGFSTPEFCLLSTSQGTLYQLLGYFRFVDMPSFDEMAFPKTFIPMAADVATVSCTGLTPYNTSQFPTSLNNTAMGVADAFLQQRSQVASFFVYSPTNGGIAGRSSDDLSMGACSNMNRGDIFQYLSSNPPEQYILLRPGAGAMMIRI